MLSILIPTYNYDITTLVNLLHDQCTAAKITFEIIVADDLSTVAYREINKVIVKFPYCTYIENLENLGRTLTRKKLADAATYGALLFLDADVMPVSDDFIKGYLPFIGYQGVFLGGIAYKNDTVDSNTILRRKYGRYREEKSAVQRNNFPYGNILSGNMLISKHIFLENNYPDRANLYGMDNFFAYRLYKNKVAVTHIDNPVYHLGLESNALFFEKCLESVRNRKKLLASAERIEAINSLLKHYKMLERFGLVPVAALFFRMGEPLLKKMILKKDPNLFCLDIYRLGYICSLK
ncbi:hypothetical protein HYN59_17150 [Flavobacterium album]|uniref:Glycosyltransferase 2-like domain-containing protein n=1 Tax=Flavobacterium album TaxID=2175091 RepID=A0A2S1R281_9FLAO|nr:glycosyltransferase [Flavobacterium album]AWH86727.1 hypothetical protein HYN59_17150 [Flavobacterium album]